MEELPLLHYQTRKFGENTFHDCVIISVFHLLSDSLYFFKAIERMGVLSEDTYIIAIPYSKKEDVVSELRNRGYQVFTPEFPIGSCVSKVLIEAYNCCEKQSKRLLIIEDGATWFQRFIDLIVFHLL
jgi:hypothetical protein